MEDLYKGTSKGAEGYAARITFQQAKELGMMVSINWQDDDYQYVNDDKDESSTQASDGREIETPIYSLSSADISTIDAPTGWLNDKVITASQNLLLSTFPTLKACSHPHCKKYEASRFKEVNSSKS